MSDWYIKVDDVELEDWSGGARVIINGHSIDIPVDAIKGIRMIDLDKYDDGIRELLRSVRKMDMNDKIKVFGPADVYSIMDTYTISEIREKYNEWKYHPKIGDEVSYDSHVGIVVSYTKISGTNYIRVLAKGENSIFCFPPDKVKKTGRHFDNVSIGDLGKYAEKAR